MKKETHGNASLQAILNINLKQASHFKIGFKTAHF